MFHEARRILGDGRYLVVGDRLDADVAGGAAADMADGARAERLDLPADVDAWTGVPPDHSGARGHRAARPARRRAARPR